MSIDEPNDGEPRESDEAKVSGMDESPFRLRLTRFERWVQIAMVFFLLANAGGAVATMIIPDWQDIAGAFAILAMLALACFAAGVLMAGCGVVRHYPFLVGGKTSSL